MALISFIEFNIVTPWYVGEIKFTPAGYAPFAYLEGYLINSLAVKASFPFCLLSLKVQVLRSAHGCALWAL